MVSVIAAVLWMSAPPEALVEPDWKSGLREAPKAEAAPEGRQIAWRSAGPGGGGWIQSIAWDPHDADTLYVGCDVGGFYVSTDAGRHFERRNQGLHDYFLEAMAVHPRDRGVILVGTESGIHRTTDQGRTWQWIRAGFPPLQQHAFSAPIGAIAFDPVRPNVVYAGIGRPRWDKGGAGAIYRSDDTGQTWRLISAGQLPADAVVRDIELQPGQSPTVLAATQHGVYRSDDEGKTWKASSQGLPQHDVEELAFAPSSPAVVYASLRTMARDAQPFDGGVCRSDDAGKTWRPVNGPGMADRVGGRSQSPYMTSQFKDLAVDPRDCHVVYAGNRSWVCAGVYKTEDGGGRWTRVTRNGKAAASNMDYGWLDFWGPAAECLAISPAAPARLAFGTSGHVFATDDGGATWQPRYGRQWPEGRFSGNGLEVTCVNAVVPDPARRECAWFCYADIGLLVTDDGGESFRRSFQGMKHAGNCFTVVVDSKSPATVWAATGQWAHNAGDVCRSDDAGRTWRVVGEPKTGLPDGQVKHLVLDPRSPLDQRRLVATSNGHGIFESRDGGLSWRTLRGNLPDPAAKQPRGLVLDSADPKRLVIALGGTPEKGAGIYVTRDSGGAWQRVNQAPLFADVTSLAADPRNTEVLYATARQHYDPATRKSFSGGLFVSRDAGRSWQRILDYRFVSAVAISPSDPRTIYAATLDHPYHDDFPAAGVLKSTDGGATWRQENTGLSHRGVPCLSIDPHNPSQLWAGTAGNGVFRGKDAGCPNPK